MAEAAWHLQAVDWLLSGLERDRGIPEGRIDLIPIIETARGLSAVDEIARASGRRIRYVRIPAEACDAGAGRAWTGYVHVSDVDRIAARKWPGMSKEGMTSMPRALMRFMIPCTDDSRKLSEPAFMMSR